MVKTFINPKIMAIKNDKKLQILPLLIINKTFVSHNYKILIVHFLFLKQMNVRQLNRNLHLELFLQSVVWLTILLRYIKDLSI
jgi:hypothetical protein